MYQIGTYRQASRNRYTPVSYTTYQHSYLLYSTHPTSLPGYRRSTLWYKPAEYTSDTCSRV